MLFHRHQGPPRPERARLSEKDAQNSAQNDGGEGWAGPEEGTDEGTDDETDEALALPSGWRWLSPGWVVDNQEVYFGAAGKMIQGSRLDNQGEPVEALPVPRRTLKDQKGGRDAALYNLCPLSP